MTNPTFDQILDALDHAQQRATYGAVAAVLGRSPRMLMRGRQRDQRHSWIVNGNTGKPTGYDDALLHPALTEHDHVIQTKDELEQWLVSGAVAVGS